jgi:hypothetical protein
MNLPLLVFVTSLGVLLLSTWIGDALRKRTAANEERAESGLMLSAILTLLFLIIGFSFSMAVNRYDLRRNAEQAEAIAIGTAYSRADLLPHGRQRPRRPEVFLQLVRGSEPRRIQSRTSREVFQRGQFSAAVPHGRRVQAFAPGSEADRNVAITGRKKAVVDVAVEGNAARWRVLPECGANLPAFRDLAASLLQVETPL